jgi:hypothetical protein
MVDCQFIDYLCRRFLIKRLKYEIIIRMYILVISLASLGINIILGRYRAKYRKFTFMWWLLIHASIPLIVPLRIWLESPAAFIPLFIGLAALGQFAGSRIADRQQAKNKVGTRL